MQMMMMMKICHCRYFKRYHNRHTNHYNWNLKHNQYKHHWSKIGGTC